MPVGWPAASLDPVCGRRGWLLGAGAGWSAQGLVVLGGVQGEFAEEFAGFGVDDADGEVGDEHPDDLAGVFAAQADVAQLGVVAQGDHAELVGAVSSDSVVRRDPWPGGLGLGSGGVGLGRGASVQGPVGADLVVVAAEPVQLALQLLDGGGRCLGGQPLLLGLGKRSTLPQVCGW